jgi:hypothetical protein
MGGRDNGGDWHQITSLDHGGHTHSGRILAARDHNCTQPQRRQPACIFPSLIPPRVNARERSTPQRSSSIGIGSELLCSRTLERPPIVLDTRFKGAYLSSSCAPIAYLPESTLESALPPNAPGSLVSEELLLARTSERSPIVPDTRFTRRLSHVVLFASLRPALKLSLNTSDRSPIVPDTRRLSRLVLPRSALR